jgi:carbon storage regulator CsrA
MLVLTRKQEQQIKIGNDITITILRVKGNTVRVGIKAPSEVRVVRAELPTVGETGQATVESRNPVVQQEVAAQDAPLPIPASNADSADFDCEPAGEVVSFRLRVAPNDEGTESPANSESARSAAHLPLRRIHNRFGSAPLKQLLASSATLAK